MCVYNLTNATGNKVSRQSSELVVCAVIGVRIYCSNKCTLRVTIREQFYESQNFNVSCWKRRPKQRESIYKIITLVKFIFSYLTDFVSRENVLEATGKIWIVWKSKENVYRKNLNACNAGKGWKTKIEYKGSLGVTDSVLNSIFFSCRILGFLCHNT